VEIAKKETDKTTVPFKRGFKKKERFRKKHIGKGRRIISKECCREGSYCDYANGEIKAKRCYYLKNPNREKRPPLRVRSVKAKPRNQRGSEVGGGQGRSQKKTSG